MTAVGRILLIDDDDSFFAFYRDILETAGLVVDTAQTADEAGRQLEAVGAEVDVVLLDLELRGSGGTQSGLDLISRIRALAPRGSARRPGRRRRFDGLARAHGYGRDRTRHGRRHMR